MTTKGRRAADRRRERQGDRPVDDGSGTSPGGVDPLPDDDDDESEPGDADLPLVSQVREIEPEPQPGTLPNRKRNVAAQQSNDAEASFVKAVRQSSSEQRRTGEVTAVRAAPDRPPRRGGRLVVLEGPDAGGEADLELTPTMVGRTAAAEIGLTDPSVSLRHAEIRWGDEGFSLLDLGSTSGTLVNGRALTEETRLRHGDVIALGKTELRFVRGDKLPEPRPEPVRDPTAPAAEVPRDPTQRVPTPTREKTRAPTVQQRAPGPDPAIVRARIRRTTTRVIVACSVILAGAALSKVVHDRFFTDKAPAQIRAQVAELLADGRNRLRAQDVEGARQNAQTVLALDAKNEDAMSLLRMADTEAASRDAIQLALRLGDEERDVEAGQILKRVPDASVFAPTRDRLKRTLDERGMVRSRRTIESLLDQGRVADAAAAALKHAAAWPADDDGKALLERARAAQAAVPKNPALAAARAAFAAGDTARAREIASGAGLRAYVRDLDDFQTALAAGKSALARFDDDAADALDRAFRLLGALGGDASSPMFAEVRRPYAKALLVTGTAKLDASPCQGARMLFRAARVMPDDGALQQKLRELDERALAGLDKARGAKAQDPERASAIARESLCLARTGSKTYDDLRALSRL